MNESKHDKQAIVEYLLGALSEAETENFDELSFTDEEFAAALSAAEKDLIDAYLHEELSGQRLEKFQNYYLASPLRLEKVNFARAFQVYAKQNFAETTEDFASGETKPKRTFSEFFSAINIFKNRNSLQWSFAVLGLAFVLAGGLWLISNRLNQPQSELAKQQMPALDNQVSSPPSSINTPSETFNRETETSPANKENQEIPANVNKGQANKSPIAEPTRTPKKEIPAAPPKITVASFVLAPSLRSGTRITSLSVSGDVTDVAMRLQLESDDYAAYRVVLLNESNARLWQSGTVKARGKDRNKTVNVSFPAKLLKSQIYSLEVSGVAADGELEIISNYVFRIVR